jgi:acetolactate synthase-1/2/3 large subunit
LAERLAAAGVRRAFGFPGGGSNLDLIEALADAGIEWVLTHTETAAAFMACATAELTGTPGVVIVGNGPGVASVVNGVAQAALDRTPLVVISDREVDPRAASSGHQVLDHRALLAPLVKYGATLSPEAIEIALAAAVAWPPGPVHLEMPRNGKLESAPAAPPAVRRSPAATLDAAERPAILVGLEANHGVEPEALRALAHRIGAAVFTTYKSKGVYPEDDPRWAGIVTNAEIERPLLSRADAILTVGLDRVELLERPWGYTAPVVADVGAPGPGFPLEEIAAAREAMLAGLRAPGGELPGWRIVETVAAELPPQTTFAVDAGAHMFPATWLVHPSGPRRFLISNGLASMGFALPAAVAAALERPRETALAFCGDGGMAYHAAELETAVRCGAKVIVVVLNDASLSLIRIKQEAKGYTRRPLSFGRTDFAGLATAYGARGAHVETADQLRAAVREALAATAGTVIDVHTSGTEYAATLSHIRG